MIIDTHLQSFEMTGATTALLRDKDGVSVYRVTDGCSSYILKIYANAADRREIRNYHILQTLGIQTLKIIGNTDNALLMEDIEQSDTLRLAHKDHMDDPAVAARLARWYRELHNRGRDYIRAHGQGMYDESDAVTLQNMETVANRTNTQNHPFWALLRESFPILTAKIASVQRTLTYNDFYYTNMIVAKDDSTAFMFDYNLLGKGYVFSDLRNVTSSLGKAAGDAFLRAYGDYDPAEELLDAAISPLTTLSIACQHETLPSWAEEELQKLHSGSLEQALRQLLQA